MHKEMAQPIVHLIHVGKTGGMAVKFALHHHLMRAPAAIYLHHHDFTLRHAHAGERVTFFLRDPISRFVSGFHSRQRQGQPRFLVPWSPEETEAFTRFTTPNALACALSSSNQTTRRHAREAMRSIEHVGRSYWYWFSNEAYLRSRADDILFIGFQETLDADFAVLRSLLGVPTAELPADGTTANRKPGGQDAALDVEALHNLRRWYVNDFRCVAVCRELREQRLRQGPLVGVR